MDPIVEVIKSRKSVRTFDRSPLSEKEKSTIKSLLNDKAGPFGGLVRIACFDLDEKDTSTLKSLGTYGIIKNAPMFMGAIVKPGPHIFEDLGYVFEEAIIKLTEEHFGTCWIGGTFTRASFSSQAGMQDDEILGAISPVGRAHKNRSFIETALRTVAGSRNRKEWGELFFNNNSSTPLTEKDAGSFFVPFECVRLAPSASNKQPWRLIQNNSGIHFFLNRTKGYSKLFKQIDLQAMDIGIAMYHFEAAAIASGLSGELRPLEHGCNEPQWVYITSFVQGA